MGKHFYSVTAPLLGVMSLILLGGCESAGFGTPGRAQPAAAHRGMDPAAMIRVADNVRKAGDYSTAVSFYRQALERTPGNVQALIGLGASYVALDAPDEAYQAYNAALDADPEAAEARLGLANGLIALGRPRAALNELQKVVILLPSDPRPLNAMGVALDLLGRNGAAQVRYGFALDLKPDDPDIRNNLALSFAFGGDLETSIALLRDLAREPGADARTRQNLALAYGLAGDFERAEAIARMDLAEDAVRGNLAFYARLRAMDAMARAVAVLLGPDFLDDQTTESEEFELLPMLIEPATIIAADSETIKRSTVALPFRLYLATYANRQQAVVGWEIQRRRNESLMAGLEPEIRELAAEDGEAPQFRLETVYRGRATDAKAFCLALAESGIPCRLAGE